MAGRPEAPASPPADGEGAVPNVVARMSQWADDHLRLVRATPVKGSLTPKEIATHRLRTTVLDEVMCIREWWVCRCELIRPPRCQNISIIMAVAGISLLLRSVRLTSKFTSPSDIPVEFIRKNVKLRGRLHRLTEDVLEIEHIPITLPIISSWRKEPCGVLLVKLAGVELTKSGKVWLQKELKPSQLLWFQLLGKENSVLFCYLLVNKGRFFNVNLNEDILRRGLGKTVFVKGLNHDSKMYWKIHKRLLKAELTALKKGEGIWKEEYEKKSYLEKFKESWGEYWKKDSYLKKIGSDFNLKKESYYDKLRSTYEAWKDNSLILKFRELVSRIHFRRKG